MISFERGQNPKHQMDVGLIATAPIVYRLLWDSEINGAIVSEYVVGVPEKEAIRILRGIKDKPDTLGQYHVELQDRGGKIFSGIIALEFYAGEHIQYQKQLFYIPKK